MNMWYDQLIKPTWAPPAWLFGPVWSALYTIIIISFGYVAIAIGKGKIPKKVAIPFILNIITNLAFTPLQFGLQSNGLAAIDIVLVWVTIVWFMKAIYPYARWVAVVHVPYLLWVSFATVLQFTITYINGL